MMRTLFLNPPSYDDFDGGAGSRYQAKREVWSFWYPTWLAYPAGMLPGRAPARRAARGPDDRGRRARSRATTTTSSSTPARRRSGPTSAPPQALKAREPDTVIGFVGGHVTRAARGVAPLSRRRSTTSRARSSTWPSWRSPRAAPLARRAGHQLPPRRRYVAQPTSPRRSTTEQLDALPFVDRRLRARPRLQEVQQPLLPVSVRLALHGPRLPGALHVLPLAAGDDRAQLPHAQRRERARGVRAA